MAIFLILALLAAALPLRAFAGGSGPAPRRVPALVSAGALVAAFAGFEVCFNRAIFEAHPASMIVRLPVVFLIRRVGEIVSASRTDELLLLALAESFALGILLANLGALDSRTRRLTVALVATALALLALTMPASDSSDSYLYVGLGTLGVHAYAPPAVPFAGDSSVINAIWGTPLLPSAYGPVWICVAAALVAPLGSLGAKLVAFKLLGLVSVLGCALLARRLGASRVVVAAIACNPALYITYVASAHNDLFATDLVLAAMLAAKRSNVPVAFAFALAACLVKLTLVPVAVVAVATQPSLRVRAAFALSLALVVGAAYASFGATMWHALVAAAEPYRHTWSPLETVFRALLATIVAATSAWIVFSGRVRAQSAWAPPAFGVWILPSYTIWGFPFAILTTPVAVTYLLSLPLLSLLQSPTLPGTPATEVAGYALLLATLAAVAYRLRPGRVPEAAARA